MPTHTLNVAPTIDESDADAVVLAELREIIMATSGVERIYPPATVPSKIVRAVGVVASAVRTAVENILPGSDEEAVVHTSEGDSQGEAQDLPEEKPLPDSEDPLTTINVRIGASAGANVLETARAVAQSIRAVRGENVAVTVDVVHI